jgi:hypothetical protein
MTVTLFYIHCVQYYVNVDIQGQAINGLKSSVDSSDVDKSDWACH